MATNENNKLTTTRPVFQTKKVGMAARLQTAQETVAKPINPEDFANRLGIVFDDSSSMNGTAIDLAHQAVETFIKNCNSNDTCLAVYPLNAKPQILSNDFAQVGLYTIALVASGGTPLYTRLTEILSKEKMTRAIAFSDGGPTDGKGSYNIFNDTGINPADHESVIKDYCEAKVPIDTVFIGDDERGEQIMKDLAARTGGTYLHFTKPEDMAKNLKYLAPRYRALLANAELKAKVERGEQI